MFYFSGSTRYGLPLHCSLVCILLTLYILWLHLPDPRSQQPEVDSSSLFEPSRGSITDGSKLPGYVRSKTFERKKRATERTPDIILLTTSNPLPRPMECFSIYLYTFTGTKSTYKEPPSTPSNPRVIRVRVMIPVLVLARTQNPNKRIN